MPQICHFPSDSVRTFPSFFSPPFCAPQHEAHEEERLDFNVDVKREGMRMEIQASEVLVGDILIVDKGDRVAADGVIYYSTGACCLAVLL